MRSAARRVLAEPGVVGRFGQETAQTTVDALSCDRPAPACRSARRRARQRANAVVAEPCGAWPPRRRIRSQRDPSGAGTTPSIRMPMAFEPDCAPVHDGHGYAIYAIARPVAGSMFRGWAEIVKDGRRVERSGLIGPRYENAEEAAAYALEWSRRWIAAQSTRMTHPRASSPPDAPHACARRAMPRRPSRSRSRSVSALQRRNALRFAAMRMFRAETSRR